MSRQKTLLRRDILKELSRRTWKDDPATLLDAAHDEIVLLRVIIERLGSDACFTTPRILNPRQDGELVARMEYARQEAQNWEDDCG